MVWIGFGCGAVLYANSGVMVGLADVSKAAGDITGAAGQLASAGANVTIKVSSMGIEALSTAQHAAGEFLYGVDLLEVTVHRTSLKMAGLSSSRLTEWLRRRDDIPAQARTWFADQVADVSTGVPSFQASDEMLLINGSYSQLWIRVRRRCDGSAAAALTLAIVEFSPSWANPGWELLGFDVGSEHTQIVDQLKKSLAKLKEIHHNVLAIDDGALLEEFGVVLGRCWPSTSSWLAGGAALLLGELVALRFFRRCSFVLFLARTIGGCDRVLQRIRTTWPRSSSSQHSTSPDVPEAAANIGNAAISDDLVQPQSCRTQAGGGFFFRPIPQLFFEADGHCCGQRIISGRESACDS